MSADTPGAAPYASLGRALKDLRSLKFRSALEMSREITFSFSYKRYAQFERGKALPSLAQLFEIAQALESKANGLVLLWAEVQMPSEELRSLFRRPDKADTVTSPSPAARETWRGPKFENTWVFGQAEHDFLEKEPWFFDVCVRLAVAFPREVTFRELGLSSRESIEKFVAQFLQPWISLKRLECSKSGIRSTEPFVYLPKSQIWDSVRRRNLTTVFNRSVEQVTAGGLNDGVAYREILTRAFSAPQAARWIAEIEAVEARFRTATLDVNSGVEPLKPYSLLMIFAPRELALPVEILRRCK